MFKTKYLVNINDFKFVDKKLDINMSIAKNLKKSDSKNDAYAKTDVRKSFVFYTEGTMLEVNNDARAKIKEGYVHSFDLIFKRKSGMYVFVDSTGIKYIKSSDNTNRIYIIKPRREIDEVSTAYIVGYKDTDEGVSIYFTHDGFIYVNHLVLMSDMSGEKYTTKCFNYLNRIDSLPSDINSVEAQVDCIVRPDNFPDIFMYMGAYNSFNIIKGDKVLVSYSEDRANPVSQGYAVYDFNKGIIF